MTWPAAWSKRSPVPDEYLGASAITLWVIAAGVIFFAKRRGFFIYPTTPPATVSFFACLGAFIIYLGLTALLLYWNRGVPALMALSAVGVLGFTFWQRDLWQSFWGKEGIVLGFKALIVVFPFVYAIMQSLEWGLNHWMGEAPLEQMIVQILKQKRHFFQYAFLAVIVAPIVEELLFRGYLYGWLRGFFNPLRSNGITAFIFSVFHLSPQYQWHNVQLGGCLFVLALCLGWVRERGGSLVAPIALHMSFNLISVVVILCST
ncbi:MAG: CPBP family intramembrane metalloprotease [Chlamydiia bacterium]|nr:CPBP family intramembrane metalloprotease [Chlamydiia bacterium]